LLPLANKRQKPTAYLYTRCEFITPFETPDGLSQERAAIDDVNEDEVTVHWDVVDYLVNIGACVVCVRQQAKPQQQKQQRANVNRC